VLLIPIYIGGEMLNHNQISKLLKTQILGVLPESDDINILSSIKFEKITKSKTIDAFMVLADNLRNEKKQIYDYESKYRGLLGIVRRNIKRGV